MPPPELIFHSGNVYTFGPFNRRAAALAVTAGRLVAVGTDEDILALSGKHSRCVSLGGRTVTPGLIDAHVHLAALGRVKAGGLDLSPARSFDELLQMVAARVAATAPGQWVLGSRWDHEAWGWKHFPSHDRLSEISPDHPVWLRRKDGHMALANRKAMELARITPDTPDPEGGELFRDRDGRPTGIFVDNAMPLVSRLIGQAEADLPAEIVAAQQACFAVGLTGVHDAGISPEEVQAYKNLCDDGRLKLRVYGMIDAETGLACMTGHEPLIGYGGDRFTLRAVKLFVDGALSTRGAWMFEAYSDRPGFVGLPVQAVKWIAEVTRLALEAGYQPCTHAIGDRGVREVLDVYQHALEQRPTPDHRLRIEHAQVVARSDIARFAAIGVIPSMQPTHATSDMGWTPDRLGPDRLDGACAWADFLRAGCRIAAGSDVPVENENPLWGVYSAVTRQDHEGRPPGGWYAHQCMTRDEAFRAFTIDAAWAAFEDHLKGSLEPGKLADFVVWDRDVMRCPAPELIVAKAVMTVIGGQSVHQETA